MRFAGLLLSSLMLLQLSAQEGDPPDGVAAEVPPASRSIVVTRDTVNVSAFFPLRSLTYAEAEPFIRNMLSRDGAMGYLHNRNSIIVHDRQEVIDQVRQFIDAIDRDPINIRVEVEFTNDYMAEEAGIGIVFDDDPRGPTVTIEDGKVKLPGKVDITARESRREGARATTQMITALSGSPAEIWAGRQIRDPSWLKGYTFRPVIVAPHASVIVLPQPPPAEWRNVGASLYVLPVRMDSGQVRVELFPVVTYHDREGGRHSFRVEEVRTTMVAQPGQRLFIGGNDQATRDFIRQLLGPDLYRRSVRSNVLGIYLTVHVQEMTSRAER